LQITSAGEGSVVLSVTGEIDLSTADELQTALDSALEAADTTEVVVDLSEVGFLDSAGLRVLVSGQRAAEERELGFRVSGAQPRVRKVIAITGLTGTLGLDVD
jgi:anti-anti-sigma factor